MAEMFCVCPTVDGYRIRNQSCPRHRAEDEKVRNSKRTEAEAARMAEDDEERVCAWAEYRKDYGIGAHALSTAQAAFNAGWKAAREGDQSGPLR
jgi:hypothetical protein